MNKKSILAVVSISLFTLIGCGADRQSTTIMADFRSLSPGEFIDPGFRQTGDTVGYVVGKFGNSQSDTIFCVALGCHWYINPDSITEYDNQENLMDTYRFTNSQLSVPDLYITDHPWLNYVQTTDLDGDGIDEIQMFHDWATSTWLSYESYDLHHGEWEYLVQPAVFCTQVRENSDTIVVFKYVADVHPDSVLTFNDEFIINDEEEEGMIMTVPKIVPIDRPDIIHHYDTCYSLPGGEPIALPVVKRDQYY